MAEFTHQRPEFNREQAEQYLDTIYGDRSVRVALAHQLPRAAFNDSSIFELPGQREALLTKAQRLTAQGADVWITPGSIKPGGTREQAQMDLGHVVWLDLDAKKATPALVAEGARLLESEGAFTVASSDEGVHAYLLLNAPLDAEDIRRVNRLLQKRYARYGADDASVDASRLLRLPGTWNHKPEYGVPQGARILSGSYVEADTADLLRHAPAVEDEEARPDATVEELTAPLPDDLLDLLSRIDYAAGQISEAFHRRVKECKEAGLTPGQATGVLTGWLTEVDPQHRYLASAERMADQVARSWNKPDTRDEEIVADPTSTPEQKDDAQEKLVLQEMSRMDAREEAIRRRAAAAQATRPKVSELVMDWDALMAQPLPEFLVEDILIEGGTALLAGESGLGKSFVVMDLLLSVATGQPFLGQLATKQAKTLYVLGEGTYDARQRVLAWANERHITRVDGFAIYPEAVNLLDEFDVDRMAAFVEEHGFDLICLDTMSQCTPGINENDNGAMAAASRAAKKLGRTVLIVHHTGKNEANGMRGASSLYGNADTVIFQNRAKRLVNGKYELLPQTFFELYLSKCKAGKDHYSLGQFERAEVDLGPDPRKDGVRLTSCVIRVREVLKVPNFAFPPGLVGRIAAQMRETGFIVPENTGKAKLKSAWENYMKAPKFAEMDLESGADKTIERAYEAARQVVETPQEDIEE